MCMFVNGTFSVPHPVVVTIYYIFSSCKKKSMTLSSKGFNRFLRFSSRIGLTPSVSLTASSIPQRVNAKSCFALLTKPYFLNNLLTNSLCMTCDSWCFLPCSCNFCLTSSDNEYPNVSCFLIFSLLPNCKCSFAFDAGEAPIRGVLKLLESLFLPVSSSFFSFDFNFLISSLRLFTWSLRPLMYP